MAKFFTKKVCLIVLASVIALGGIIWAVVANITPKFNSHISDVPLANYVSGNGTASVMVDNYLYFVGDSVATSDIKYGDNEYYPKGNIPDSGIYRVKIGENSQPILDYKYDNSYIDENTEEKKEWQLGDENYNKKVTSISDWDNIGKKNNGIEAVVPKIAGHDKTAMWVFGKYLIYTTPHNRYDNRGNLMSDYLDFFRVELNGKNNTLIYTSDSTNLTTKDFTVWADATDNIYLLVSASDNTNEKPETKIKKINIITKEITVLDRNVSNVVLPTATQYKNGNVNERLSDIYSGVMSYVYYTKSRDEKSSILGNLLYRCGIKDNATKIIADYGNNSKGTTFTPLAVTPLDVDGAHASAQFVFSVSISSSNATFVEKDLCVVTNKDFDSYTYVDREANVNGLGLKENSEVKIYANGFCTIDSKLYHYDIQGSQIILDKENGEAKKILGSTTVDSVLAVIGDTIYVQSGSTVYVVKKNGSSSTIATAVTTTSSDSESETEDKKVNTLPIAVLYQPQGNNGDPMVFVEDDDSIRLYSANQMYKYVRFKVQ
ncbi:MAG: hypothetical protein MJ054_00285 [Clostridia bacterium]|nr:hypothetical protein [Clostridia bacterium]